jgi:hypothetical protein
LKSPKEPGLGWLLVCVDSPANAASVLAVALQPGGAPGAAAAQALAAVAAGGGTAMSRRSSTPSTGQASRSSRSNLMHAHSPQTPACCSVESWRVYCVGSVALHPSSPPPCLPPPLLPCCPSAAVQSVRPFGVFVKMDGYHKYGLVHFSQVGWGDARVGCTLCCFILP